MKWIPYDSFEIHTDLPPEVVMRKISHVTCRNQFFQKKSELFVFAGDVGDLSFKVSKCISYRNSFLPVLHGTVKPTEYGSTIFVKQKLHRIVKWFLIYWFGFLTLFSLLLFAARAKPVDFVIPAIMAVFGYCLTYFAFWVEARNTKKLLEDIF